jgi:hypothetical protein
MLFLDETKLMRRSLARNKYLFRQGDKVQAIYFVEDGRLRLDRRTFDGRSLVFGTSSAGEFFVEAALFAEIFRCDAVATEPSRVFSKTLVTKASKLIVLPSLRSNSIFSIPTAQAASPLMRMCGVSVEMVMRSN